MQFTKTGFIVICKEPDECVGYFVCKNDPNYLTCDIEDAEIFPTEKSAEKYINDCDDPELYVYKPIEVVYTIENLKFS